MMIWSTGGVTVNVPDRAALLTDVARCFETKQGFCVATLNLDHVVKLAKNTTFEAAYAAQTHVTADGNPIVWLSRLARQNVSLVPGSELIEPLAELAARHKVPVALFGATEAALSAAAAGLVRRYPALEIVLCRSPAMGFDPQSDAAAKDIAALDASGARLCFLALGAPKQEILAARGHAALRHVGFVSIGAGLDFIAGTQRRAPDWVQAIAAEWLWRLLGNPTRLAVRYAACFRVLPGLIKKALHARRHVGSPP